MGLGWHEQILVWISLYIFNGVSYYKDQESFSSWLKSSPKVIFENLTY